MKYNRPRLYLLLYLLREILYNMYSVHNYDRQSSTACRWQNKAMMTSVISTIAYLTSSYRPNASIL